MIGNRFRLGIANLRNHAFGRRDGKRVFGRELGSRAKNLPKVKDFIDSRKKQVREITADEAHAAITGTGRFMIRQRAKKYFRQVGGAEDSGMFYGSGDMEGDGRFMIRQRAKKHFRQMGGGPSQAMVYNDPYEYERQAQMHLIGSGEMTRKEALRAAPMFGGAKNKIVYPNPNYNRLYKPIMQYAAH